MSNFRLLKRRSPYPELGGEPGVYLERRLPVERESYEQAAEAINRALLLPSFRVHLNGTHQTGVASTALTKIAFTSIASAGAYEGYDDFGYFDRATSYRFTPLVAGVYGFCLSVGFVACTAGAEVLGSIWKNSTALVGHAGAFAPGTVSPQVSASGQCRMNGATDFVEFFCQHSSSGNQSVNGTTTFATGCKLADY